MKALAFIAPLLFLSLSAWANYHDDDGEAAPTCPKEVSTSHCCSEDPSWGASGFEVSQCGCEGLPYSQCTLPGLEHRCAWEEDASLELTCSGITNSVECESNGDCEWEASLSDGVGACHYMGCYDRTCESLDDQLDLVAKRPDCSEVFGLAFRNTDCSCADTRDTQLYCPCLADQDGCENIDGCIWSGYGCSVTAESDDDNYQDADIDVISAADRVHSELGMFFLTATIVALNLPFSA